MSRHGNAISSRMMRSHITIADMCHLIEVKTNTPCEYGEVQKAYHTGASQYNWIIEQILDEVEVSKTNACWKNQQGVG